MAELLFDAGSEYTRTAKIAKKKPLSFFAIVKTWGEQRMKTQVQAEP